MSKSSKRAYKVVINETPKFEGATATFESYGDLFSFIIGHVARRVMAPTEPLVIKSLSLFGTELPASAKDELLTMANDTLSNVAW
jgi:hypothetical protein